MSKSNAPTPTAAPSAAAPAPVAAPADLVVVRLRKLLEDAVGLAQDVDALVERTRVRGDYSHDDKTWMRIWRNDAGAAWSIVNAVKAVEHYLAHQRDTSAIDGA
jgi:hypothetical protein